MKSYNGVAILSRLQLALNDAPRLVRAAAIAATCKCASLRAAARWNCIISTCRPAATSPIPSPTRNSPTSSISSREATNWFAARGARPRTVLVGDLNIAPLEHDVWSHKQLLDVVSHTPIEVEHLLAWQTHRLRRRGAPFRPASRKTLYLVELPQPGLARVQPRAAAGPYLGQSGPEAALKRYGILQDARDWPQTSDHVPVMVEI